MRNRMHPTKTGRDDRGSSIVLFAVVLVVLMIFAAFSVDVGAAYAQRRQNQGSVDTATLAGGMRLLTTGDYVKAIKDVKARVADEFGTRISGADWAACTDPNALAIPSTTYSVTEGTPCISFGNDPDTNALRMRVRLPDVSSATSFAAVIGFDSLTTHAAAEINVGSPLGGAFPSFVYSGTGPGAVVCVFSGPPGHPTPCSGQNSGQFGTFDPMYYQPGCLSAFSNTGTGWKSVAPAIADGLDHLLLPDLQYTPGNPSLGERQNGASNCTEFGPNSVQNVQGNSQDTLITAGMLVGQSGAQPVYKGRLDGGPYANGGTGGTLNTASMADIAIDNAPLWSFLVNPLPAGVPLECAVASELLPKRSVSDSNAKQLAAGLSNNGVPLYSTPEKLMAGCLGKWTVGMGPIFSMDFAKSRRSVSVPRYHETAPLSSGYHHIRDFVPLFLTGEFQDANGNMSSDSVALDPRLTHWAGDPIPGQGNLYNSWNKNNSDKILAGVAGIYVPCGTLPRDICRPTGNPADNGFGGDVHGVTLRR